MRRATSGRLQTVLWPRVAVRDTAQPVTRQGASGARRMSGYLAHRLKIALSPTNGLKVCGYAFQPMRLRYLCSNSIRNVAADF